MLNMLINAAFCLYWCHGSTGVKVPLGKVVGLEVLYNFGLYKFFSAAGGYNGGDTTGCYNVLTITYFNHEFGNP